MYGLVFESTNLVSKQFQDSSVVMTRALVLVRSQIVRVREFPLRFEELWTDATTSLSTLREEMKNAANLIHRTRSNRQCVSKEKLRAEFVSTCNTVANDMAARFGDADHEIMLQGLQAFVPGSHEQKRKTKEREAEAETDRRRKKMERKEEKKMEREITLMFLSLPFRFRQSLGSSQCCAICQDVSHHGK
jgi:hypothetical protein